ncbi:MAG: hypothetical protein ACREFJ_01875 [Acetobacteraceae bacterium]
MSLRGQGVLAIWNDIACGTEREFMNWHVHEHIPERVALPGFLRGRRYRAIAACPKFFNFYETAEVTDLCSPVYRAELDRPSPRTRDVVRSFSNTTRVICDVSLTIGRGEGAFVENLRLETRLAAEAFRQILAETVLRPASQQAGIVGVHLLRGRPEIETAPTAEASLRQCPDGTAAWVVLLEAVDVGVIEALHDGPLHESRWHAAGCEGEAKRGLYALQFSLEKADLDGTAG